MVVYYATQLALCPVGRRLSHFIDWHESFYLLTQVILFVDSSCFFTRIILLSHFIDLSYFLLTQVILFIDSSHFIY